MEGLLFLCVGAVVFPLMLFLGFASWLADRSSEKALWTTAIGTIGTAGELWALWEGIGMPNFSKGRLLRIRGRARTASLVNGERWIAPITVDASDLSERERSIVGAAWTRAAQLEHASVAAFSELSLRLLALGAPPDLVQRSHQAALDEVRHAEDCFGVAASMSGARLSPGPFPDLHERRSRPNAKEALGRLARGSLLDGVLGEGVASRTASLASARAVDPKLREILETIAADEGRHAELAWDTLVWCVDQGGAPVKAIVAKAAASLDREATASFPEFDGVDRARLERYGILTSSTLESTRDAVIRETKARVEALLSTSVSRPLLLTADC